MGTSYAVPRSLGSLVLARMGTGGSGPRNDGVRVPDHSLVPTIGKKLPQRAGLARLYRRPGR